MSEQLLKKTESEAEKPHPLVRLSGIAAPYATVMTLAFIGTLYLTAHTRMTLAFRDFGLLPHIVNIPIQAMVATGFSLIIPATFVIIVGVVGIAIIVSLILKLFNVIFRRKDSVPRIRISKGLLGLTGAFYLVCYGSVAGVTSYFITYKTTEIYDCRSCKNFTTDKSSYVGRILGQDGEKTVLATPQGAVILNTGDIRLVTSYKPPKQVKIALTPAFRASRGKYEVMPKQ